MPETDVGSATTTDMSNALADFSVDSQTTDGPSESKETFYINEKWAQQLGYYKDEATPELSSVIDAKATWTIGKGFTADEITTLILDNIKGFGKDTFNTIMENMIRTYHIGGDAFAEIITNKEGILINLKPLDPSTVKIIVDKAGLIIRYEQISKVKGKPSKPFSPEKIFHLARNRVADEIHGVSIINKLRKIILMKAEAMDDWKIALHRNVVPQIIWHLDSDDSTVVSAFQTKVDNMVKNRENIIIPKGAVEREVAGVPSNSTLNPLPWINMLDNKFYEAAQVPKIVVGGVGGITEAAVKIAYLAFQQTIEEEQLYNEEQTLAQLNLVVNFEFPVSLENEALSDKPKVEEPTAEQRPIEKEKAAQPNDTKVEMEGKK